MKQTVIIVLIVLGFFEYANAYSIEEAAKNCDIECASIARSYRDGLGGVKVDLKKSKQVV